MKIKQFTIENYRAIEHIDLKLNYSINPIIGVNESGKTSILKAILAFDQGRDKYSSGEHLDPQNKYSTKDTKNCRVSALINLDKQEIEELIRFAKVRSDSEDHKVLHSIDSTTDFLLSRLLRIKSRSYEYNHDGLTSKTSERVKKFLISHIPFILYFDDFTDRVPVEFQFPEDYISTGSLPRNKNRDWLEIIEEIFRRADLEGIDDEETPLQSFMRIGDRDRKGDILSDIEQVLDKEIINEWKKIKKSGSSNFADDSAKLELKIVNPESNKFEFKVKDKSNDDKLRTFNVNERSKGFQWFFNYMIKLKFNPRYQKKQENSIFLLDEPGSYLHSSAQGELLNELSSVSKKNTIVYCTHSQYLLNPTVIRLGSIKITEKHESKISLHEYGNYKTNMDRGALSPVYQALQLNFAHDFVGKLVITEGVTDFYFFELIRLYAGLIDTSINIIPGVGSGNSSTLLSLAIPFSDDYLLLFDNDKGGKDALKKYKKEFGNSILSKCHFYQQSKEKFQLEDHFSKNDGSRLLNLTKSDNIKKALGILFYDLKEAQCDFIKSLDDETTSNVEDTITRINLLTN